MEMKTNTCRKRAEQMRHALTHDRTAWAACPHQTGSLQRGWQSDRCVRDSRRRDGWESILFYASIARPQPRHSSVSIRAGVLERYGLVFVPLDFNYDWSALVPLTLFWGRGNKSQRGNVSERVCFFNQGLTCL